jgi:hypothetical protein
MIAKVLALTSALSLAPCAANFAPISPRTDSAIVDLTAAAPDPVRLAAAITTLKDNDRRLSDPNSCATALGCGVSIVRHAAVTTAVGAAVLTAGVGLVYLHDFFWRNSSVYVLHNTGLVLVNGGAYTMAGGVLAGALGAVVVGTTALAPTPVHAAELEDGLLASPDTLSRLLKLEPNYIQDLGEAHPRLGHALIALAAAVHAAGIGPAEFNSADVHRSHRR